MKLIRGENISEANIQAELYHQCKLANVSIYLEYKIKKTDSKRGCRFDAVILDEYDNIVLIIECKSRTKKTLEELQESNQAKRYKEFGVPVAFVTQDTNIKKFVKEVKSKYFYPELF